MKNISTIFIANANLLLIAVLLSSCSHYYYGPNSVNVPLLQNKGDVRVSAALAAADESSGFELQSSYAPAPHFGIMLNLYTAWGESETRYSNGNISRDKGRGSYVEAGGGYFTNAGAAGKWIFEAYAGAGTGTIKNDYGDSETSKIGITKLFLQPSVGYQNVEGTVQLAVASRFSSVHLKVKAAGVSIDNLYDYSQIELVKSNPNHILWEPSFIIRIGLPSAKVHLQITPSRAFNKKDIQFQDGVFSTGIIFSLNSFKK